MRREAFSSLLQGVYLLYEPPMHRQAAVRDARIAEVGAEAREFVSMMYDLWATPADGAPADAGRGCDVLNAAQFRRAAHQHPLLVQAFQLAALDAELDADLAAPHELGAGPATPTTPAARAAPAAPATPPTPRTPAAPAAPSTRPAAASRSAAPAESAAGGLQPIASSSRAPRRLDGVAWGSPGELQLTMRAASATTVCLGFESNPAPGSPPRPPSPSGSGRLSPQQALIVERPQILFDYFQ